MIRSQAVSKQTKEATEAKPRRVALMVESAVAPRRRMLAGVAPYVREHEPWAISLKPHRVEKSLRHWLKQCDGITAAVTELDAQELKEFGTPIVDVVGLFRDGKIPLVHANDRSV